MVYNGCKEIKSFDIVKMKYTGRFGMIIGMAFPWRTQKFYRIEMIRSKSSTYPSNNSIIIADENDFEKLYSVGDKVRRKKDGKIGKLVYTGFSFIAVEFDDEGLRFINVEDIEKVERSDHLVWNHNYSNSENVLGHSICKNKDDGVYVYCSLNDTSKERVPEFLKKSLKFNVPMPKITKVIFNYPATIVMWSDKTKR